MTAASTTTVPARRGAPLAVLVALLAIWIGGRALLWESPLLSDHGETRTVALAVERASEFTAELEQEPEVMSNIVPTLKAQTSLPIPQQVEMSAFQTDRTVAPRVADTTDMSGFAGADKQASTTSDRPSINRSPPSRQAEPPPFAPPLTRPPPFAAVARADRWSLDAWAFWREGSQATPVAQNRVPVYGASQAGTTLRYRLAPDSTHDPQAFVRGYRALVPDGETELAIGASVRPAGSIPISVVAELRGTDDRVGTELRPAAYAFTEIAPADLPAGFSLEAYGGAGYVGGRAETAFIDGLMVATREVARTDDGDGIVPRGLRVNLGGGAWGGAQRDASRLDIGPSMRLDFSVAEVPARLSIDYRERVAGNAAPRSGITATLSTRF